MSSKDAAEIGKQNTTRAEEQRGLSVGAPDVILASCLSDATLGVADYDHRSESKTPPRSPLSRLGDDNIVCIFEFMDLHSNLTFSLVSKRYWQVLRSRQYYATLIRRHLPKSVFGNCGTYDDFRAKRNALVDFLNSLLGDTSVYSACLQVESRDFEEALGVELLLDALLQSINNHSGVDSDSSRLLRAIFPSGGIPAISKDLLLKLSAFTKRRRREREWRMLCSQLPGNNSDQRDSGKSTNTLEGRHECEEGFRFIASLQLSGTWDEELVDLTIGAVSLWAFKQLCPTELLNARWLKGGMARLRAHVAQLNRFAVLDVLVNALFSQPRTTSLIKNRADLHSEEYVLSRGIALGLRGADSHEYYSPSNAFIDAVLSNGSGLPLTLCALLCIAAGRIGLEGLHLLNLPNHVQCGLSFRVGHDEPILNDVREKLGLDNKLPWANPAVRLAVARDCAVLIDCFHGGRMMVCRRGADSNFELAIVRAPSPVTMWMRQINNLSNSMASIVQRLRAASSRSDDVDGPPTGDYLEALLYEFVLQGAGNDYVHRLRGQPRSESEEVDSGISFMTVASKALMLRAVEVAARMIFSRIAPESDWLQSAPLSSLVQHTSSLSANVDVSSPSHTALLEEILKTVKTTSVRCANEM
jgi:hypothetical protein